MGVHIYVHMRVCARVYWHIRARGSVCQCCVAPVMCSHTYTHTHTHTCTLACTLIYTHVSTHLYTHVSTHCNTTQNTVSYMCARGIQVRARAHIFTLWFYNRRSIRKCRKSSFRLALTHFGPIHTVPTLSSPQNKHSKHLKTLLFACHSRFSRRCAQNLHCRPQHNLKIWKELFSFGTHAVRGDAHKIHTVAPNTI